MYIDDRLAQQRGKNRPRKFQSWRRRGRIAHEGARPFITQRAQFIGEADAKSTGAANARNSTPAEPHLTAGKQRGSREGGISADRRQRPCNETTRARVFQNASSPSAVDDIIGWPGGLKWRRRNSLEIRAFAT